MEDLFYFTKSALTLQDFWRIAEREGHQCKIHEYPNGPALHIYYSDRRFWQCVKTSEEQGDYDSFEPSEYAFVADYQPASSFVISYHTVSVNSLALLLKIVLTEYGGWLGSDENNFEPIYTVDNIDSLHALS